MRCDRLRIEQDNERDIPGGFLRQVWAVDDERPGDAPQGRTLEFLPLDRPVLAGVQKFHQGGLREHFRHEPLQETISQISNRQRLNARVEFIEHHIELFAGAHHDGVPKALFVREEAVKRADLGAGAGSYPFSAITTAAASNMAATRNLPFERCGA
jgi:hypothetical protein